LFLLGFDGKDFCSDLVVIDFEMKNGQSEPDRISLFDKNTKIEKYCNIFFVSNDVF